MVSNPKTLLESYELFPKKSLGQNFMPDPQALDKIVDCAGLTAADAVVEVGAGTGSLTAKLAERCREVFAIEVDQRLQPVLEDRFDDVSNVYLVFDDVLKTDVNTLVGNQAYIVVANVPYYISSAILWRFLEADLPLCQLHCRSGSQQGNARIVHAGHHTRYGRIERRLFRHGT